MPCHRDNTGQQYKVEPWPQDLGPGHGLLSGLIHADLLGFPGRPHRIASPQTDLPQPQYIARNQYDVYGMDVQKAHLRACDPQYAQSEMGEEQPP